MAPVLGYCAVRGLGEPIRMLLHHTGTDFEDKRFTFGPPPEYERDEWINLKPNMDMDFPNLPYYIDGEVRLTQTLAILRHLGRKHGLMPGDTEAEMCRGDLVEQQVVDLIWAFVRLTFLNKKFDEEKDSYLEELQTRLQAFSKFMGNASWLLGERLTYIDFLFHEVLEWHLFLDPKCLDSFGNLQAFVAKLKALPNVAKYINSESF